MKLKHIWAVTALLLTGRGSIAAVNGDTPEGAHNDADGGITYKCGTAITETNCLVKASGDPLVVAPTALATDEPIGVSPDTCAVGDYTAVDHFGIASRTRLVTVSAAVTAGARLYTAASGRASSSGGTGKWLIGRALQSASAAGQAIAFEPCFPVVQA